MPQNLTAFFREFVAQSKPCIIKGAFNNWPALKLWDIDYLAKKAGHLDISADLTPSGHGDCVAPAPGYSPLSRHLTPESVPEGAIYDPSQVFVKPHQARIKFSHFLEALQKHQTKLRNGDPSAEEDEVYYLQHQNDSFRKEFVEVLGADLDDSIEQFGNNLFGGSPDAINFWAGDSRAVSSMHKDHYENLYCVVKGTKRFTLLPPTDLPWLDQKWFREANFERNEEGKLVPVIQEPENAIPWIPIDPDLPEAMRREKYERAANISPLHVDVHEGEMLYLPALVYHKVAQIGDESEGKVIAINYWWDMQFGTSYTYYKLIEAMVAQRDSLESFNAARNPSTTHSSSGREQVPVIPSSASSSSNTSSAPSNPPMNPLAAAASSFPSVFVGNLPFEMTPDQLKSIFEKYGAIKHIVMPSDGGKSKGFAFVQYVDSEAAFAAQALNGFAICGRFIRVAVSNPR